MGHPGSNATIVAFPPRASRPADAQVGDLRFRALTGEAGWAKLPAAVRDRFGKRIADCRSLTYSGEIIECRMSKAGWLLAQAGRLFGAPLPLSRDVCVPAIVTLTEDPVCAGQFWTRIYGRRRGFPQVIHSSKRFCGPTGLEEHVGRGFGIALGIEVDGQALHFFSDHYFLALGRWRLRLPRCLAPGALRVSHIDCSHGRFAFVLALVHPWLGELIHQVAMFADPRELKSEETVRDP